LNSKINSQIPTLKIIFDSCGLNGSNYFECMTILEKLSELEITLPAAPKAAGLYKTILIEGRLAMFSGHLPILEGGSMITGKVGVDLTVEEGALAARQVGLNIIASLQSELGDLDRVERVCKLLGMVNSESSFTQHPLVVNGCSKLFCDIWGDDLGVGVRSAFGVSGLPGNVAVEIEGTFLLKE
jgi:enamine deaminase RidA (YjgF/YER057c/UK114 family)